MAEKTSVNARLADISTLANLISSAWHNEARNQPGTFSRSSGTLDILESILPQVKELLGIFDKLTIAFRDQKRCRILKEAGLMEVSTLEHRLSSSRKPSRRKYLISRSLRDHNDEGSLSNEDAYEVGHNIARIVKDVKDISNTAELVTRKEIAIWLGDSERQRNFHEHWRWQARDREYASEAMSLLSHPAFLSWASFSDPPSLGIHTPKDLDLKRIFWHQNGSTTLRRILACTIIESLMKDAVSKNVGIAYYHLDGFGTSSQIIGTLACQLCERQEGDLPARVLELYHTSHMSSTSDFSLATSLPTLEDLCEIFINLCSQFSGTIIVLDGLDEQGFDDHEIPFMEFSRIAKWALTSTSSKYFVTSRHPFDIRKIFNRPTTATLDSVLDTEEPFSAFLDYEVTDSNLCRYLDQQLTINTSAAALVDYELFDEIVWRIKESAEGVFPLARLQFSIALSKTCRRDIRKALKTLPSQPEEIYETLLGKIRRQDEDQARLAHKSLLWLATSRRPLKTGELRYAITIERGVDFIDRDIMPTLQSIESCSMGLIYADSEKGVFSLVHETLRNYLQTPEKQNELVPRGETWILSNCLTLLTSKSVGKPCTEAKDLEKRRSSDSFLNYAATYWGSHAKSVCDAEDHNYENSKATESSEENEENEILEFLRNDEALLSAMQIAGPVIILESQKQGRQTSQILTRTSALCAAATYGLLSIVKHLLSSGADPNMQDSWGETPLHLASYCGHEKVVTMLLSKSFDVTVRDSEGRTPLDCANAQKRREIREILVEHVEKSQKSGVESPNTDRRALLFAAIYEGNVEKVHHLTEDRLELHGRDAMGQTVLQAAAKHGDPKMFMWLMSYGADLEEGEDAKSPFFIAVENHHEALVRLLLDLGTDINAKAGDGRQPLHCAAAQGSTALIELLIRNGADVNSVDNDGRSPLYHATSNCNFGAVELLLRHDAAIPVTSPQVTSLEFSTLNHQEEVELSWYSSLPMKDAQRSRSKQQKVLRKLLMKHPGQRETGDLEAEGSSRLGIERAWGSEATQ